MSFSVKKLEKSGISVVIGSYNRKHFLKKTIETVRKELESSTIPYEIIIVDGGSSDGSINWLINQKDIITIIQHNRGEWKGKPIERRSWGYFMNLGFKSAKGKYVCMLSDDCLVVPGAIISSYNLFEERLREGENIGAVAFYWRNWPDDKKYRVGLTSNNKIFVNHGLFTKAALEDVGYADEINYFFYHADTDLCLKMWEKNYIIIDAPSAFIEHYQHANIGIRKTNDQSQKKDWQYYCKRWSGEIVLDPFNAKKEVDYQDIFYTANEFRMLHYAEFGKRFLLRYILKRLIHPVT